MTSSPSSPLAAERLSRVSVVAAPQAPVRIAHLGLGGFARAHQAWYVARSPDADRWGIAGFTGRSPALARALGPQDGLYTLVTRSDHETAYDVIGSLSEVHAAQDIGAWLGLFGSKELAIVTLTVTEAGYCRNPRGDLDLDRDDVRHDADALRGDPTAPVSTVPGRVVAGLLARRASGAGAITILPCDNLPHNGLATATVVEQLADLVDPTLAGWLGDHVSFAGTMVDRITPRTQAADRDEVLAATGFRDEAPVVTEPFSEWVVTGAFPAGRPSWESSGVQMVDDVEPFETRKLWLLNGAHSLLALAGSVRGHQTVAAAVADPMCRSWIEQWWDEAQLQLALPAEVIGRYRALLMRRFSNAAIQHQLAQIAKDSSQKVPIRFLPVLRAERAAGRSGVGAARAIAAWVVHLRGAGVPVDDPEAEQWIALCRGPIRQAAQNVLARLEPALRADADLVSTISGLVADLAP